MPDPSDPAARAAEKIIATLRRELADMPDGEERASDCDHCIEAVAAIIREEFAPLIEAVRRELAACRHAKGAQRDMAKAARRRLAAAEKVVEAARNGEEHFLSACANSIVRWKYHGNHLAPCSNGNALHAALAAYDEARKGGK